MALTRKTLCVAPVDITLVLDHLHTSSGGPDESQQRGVRSRACAVLHVWLAWHGSTTGAMSDANRHSPSSKGAAVSGKCFPPLPRKPPDIRNRTDELYPAARRKGGTFGSALWN